jgi:RimJ/RimL family protein N-acetyltransferase
VSRSWPLFDLRLRHGDLLLRPVSEADLPTLVALLPEDVELDPSLPAERAYSVHQGYWRALGSWSAQAWALSMLVLRADEPLGVQVLEGTQFPVLRTVDTASWLRADARGQGVGKAMRTAVLGFAFRELGAQAAVSSAWHDNRASLGVSRRLGYRPNGEHLHKRGDRADLMVHLRLPRGAWVDPGVRVEGFQGCRHLFDV